MTTLPTITVDARIPARGLAGSSLEAGDRERLIDARFLSPDRLATAHDLARAVIHELRQVPESRRDQSTPWWRVVRLGSSRLEVDVRDYAAWLVACSLPGGRCLATSIAGRPTWLVEAWPAQSRDHQRRLHARRRLLDDGRAEYVPVEGPA